jgi:hypothetical protein
MPTGPVNQEAWYDIEYGCYVLEECPLPPLAKDYLASAVAQDNHPSLGLSQDASSAHSNGNTQCTSQDPGADGLPRPKHKDNEHGSGESVSELEKYMLQAFKQHEDGKYFKPPTFSPPQLRAGVPSSRPRTGSEHARGTERRLTASYSIAEGDGRDTDLF